MNLYSSYRLKKPLMKRKQFCCLSFLLQLKLFPVNGITLVVPCLSLPYQCLFQTSLLFPFLEHNLFCRNYTGRLSATLVLTRCSFQAGHSHIQVTCFSNAFQNCQLVSALFMAHTRVERTADAAIDAGLRELQATVKVIFVCLSE